MKLQMQMPIKKIVSDFIGHKHLVIVAQTAPDRDYLVGKFAYEITDYGYGISKQKKRSLQVRGTRFDFCVAGYLEKYEKMDCLVFTFHKLGRKNYWYRCPVCSKQTLGYKDTGNPIICKQCKYEWNWCGYEEISKAGNDIYRTLCRRDGKEWDKARLEWVNRQGFGSIDEWEDEMEQRLRDMENMCWIEFKRAKEDRERARKGIT